MPVWEPLGKSSSSSSPSIITVVFVIISVGRDFLIQIKEGSTKKRKYCHDKFSMTMDMSENKGSKVCEFYRAGKKKSRIGNDFEPNSS